MHANSEKYTPVGQALSSREAVATGKEARKVVPRSSQANWWPGPDRVGPLEVLAEQDQARVPEIKEARPSVLEPFVGASSRQRALTARGGISTSASFGMAGAQRRSSRCNRRRWPAMRASVERVSPAPTPVPRPAERRLPGQERHLRPRDRRVLRNLCRSKRGRLRGAVRCRARRAPGCRERRLSKPLLLERGRIPVA
jgi:hypothetical protein